MGKLLQFRKAPQAKVHHSPAELEQIERIRASVGRIDSLMKQLKEISNESFPKEN